MRSFIAEDAGHVARGTEAGNPRWSPGALIFAHGSPAGLRRFTRVSRLPAAFGLTETGRLGNPCDARRSCGRQTHFTHVHETHPSPRAHPGHPGRRHHLFRTPL